jgi:hypothetical protein
LYELTNILIAYQAEFHERYGHDNAHTACARRRNAFGGLLLSLPSPVVRIGVRAWSFIGVRLIH